MNALTVDPIVAAPAAPSPARRIPRALLAGGAALLLAAAGVAWIVSPASSESTDNAYLRADSTVISSRIGGQIAEMLVHDNQQVRVGQPLVRIDDREFAARLAAAQAAMHDADAGVAAARAALVSHGAENRLADADVAVARTAIASSEAEQRRAEADKARFEALVQRGFATRRDAERMSAVAAGAGAQARHDVASLAATRDRGAVTAARRATLEAELERALAGAERARAALDLAKQDRGYTLVRAPVSGVVGNRQSQAGDYVQPGTRLLTIVPSRGLYVVANFKETQTRRMLVGQTARVKVDALDGAPLEGRIESFAPASGSEFSLLPFEPGSGNFTKIVQRVPVRIVLDPAQPRLARLRPGLSTTVEVRLDR
jgi:membrane fusion protein (multidrug efflux system)